MRALTRSILACFGSVRGSVAEYVCSTRFCCLRGRKGLAEPVEATCQASGQAQLPFLHILRHVGTGHRSTCSTQTSRSTKSPSSSHLLSMHLMAIFCSSVGACFVPVTPRSPFLFVYLSF